MSTPIQSPAELAAKFERQLVETTRRWIAMRRLHPDCVCRWRRAAKVGPNADLALVFFWRKGLSPETEIWPYAKIERLAAEVTDEEVFAELDKIGRASCRERVCLVV